MNRTEVLSVNPTAKTLGAMHPELARCLAQGSRIIGAHSGSVADYAVNFLSATRHPSAMRLGFALLVLRIGFGTLLIVAGAFAIDPAEFASNWQNGITSLTPHWLAIVQIISGALLCLGCFTRLSMAATSVAFATMASLAIIAGDIPELTLMYTFGSLVFVVMGAGCISTDALIRRAIMHCRHNRSETRLAKKRLSYEAFKYSSRI